MNILVLNGSPSGENSITLQTVRFLQKYHTEDTFEILHDVQAFLRRNGASVY